MKARKNVIVEFEFATKDGKIETLEGVVSYKKGDAIITGIKGEKYPCRRDIFDESYTIVEKYDTSDLSFKKWYKWIEKGKYRCKCGQEVDSYERGRHVVKHFRDR